MIEISISSELAGEHQRFMAECAERGHRVEVFDSGEAYEPARGRVGRGECEAVVPNACAPAAADGR